MLDLSDLQDLNFETQDDDIEDAELKGLKFAFIGAGQAGCNLVAAFRSRRGYRRTLFFNTTSKDIDSSIPEAFHIVPPGYDGAGKDRNLGKKAAIEASGEVTSMMAKYFKTVGFIFICTSTAGGTGSGATMELVKIARNYLVTVVGCSAKEAEDRVGVIAVLPGKTEGGAALANTASFLLEALNDDGTCSFPFFVVDNDALASMKDPIGKFPKTNAVITTIFDAFNSISSKHSNWITFDPKDYYTVLSSGLITAGINAIKRFEKEDDIARAIRLNLTSTAILSGLNVQGATHAAIVIVAPSEVLDNIPSSALDSARSTLLSMMGGTGEPVIHTGVYNSDDSSGIQILTLIGGFYFSNSRLEQYKKLSSSPK